jgi:hypothetical protein
MSSRRTSREATGTVPEAAGVGRHAEVALLVQDPDGQLGVVRPRPRVEVGAADGRHTSSITVGVDVDRPALAESMRRKGFDEANIHAPDESSTKIVARWTTRSRRSGRALGLVVEFVQFGQSMLQSFRCTFGKTPTAAKVSNMRPGRISLTTPAANAFVIETVTPPASAAAPRTSRPTG